MKTEYLILVAVGVLLIVNYVYSDEFTKSVDPFVGMR